MSNIVDTITRRIAELEDELGRLRAAREALVAGGPDSGAGQSRGRKGTASGRAASTGGAKARVARGVRIEQTRSYLADHPKAKDTELANALGISRQQAQQLRKKLQS